MAITASTASQDREQIGRKLLPELLMCLVLEGQAGARDGARKRLPRSRSTETACPTPQHLGPRNGLTQREAAPIDDEREFVKTGNCPCSLLRWIPIALST